MGNPIALDMTRAVHLCGLALGLGLGIFADLAALKSLYRRLETREVAMLYRAHRFVIAGLVLLWISGLGILYFRTGFDLSQFSPKLWTKLAVVGVLSVNAALIGRFALPVMSDLRDRRFGELARGLRLRLAAIIALSMAGWISALALGAITHLKPLDGAMLAAIFLPLYALFMLGGLGLALAAPGIARLGDRALNPKPGIAVLMERAAARETLPATPKPIPARAGAGFAARAHAQRR